MNILVFGDSIAYGAWDKDGGWVQRLRKFLDAKNLSDPNSYFLLYNLGISGDNTEKLLGRIDPEIRARLEENKPLAIIFAIGTNDSQFVMNQNNNGVSPVQFAENMRALIG